MDIILIVVFFFIYVLSVFLAAFCSSVEPIWDDPDLGVTMPSASDLSLNEEDTISNYTVKVVTSNYVKEVVLPAKEYFDYVRPIYNEDKSANSTYTFSSMVVSFEVFIHLTLKVITDAFDIDTNILFKHSSLVISFSLSFLFSILCSYWIEKLYRSIVNVDSIQFSKENLHYRFERYKESKEYNSSYNKFLSERYKYNNFAINSHFLYLMLNEKHRHQYQVANTMIKIILLICIVFVIVYLSS